MNCDLCIYLSGLSTTVNQNKHKYMWNRFTSASVTNRHCKGLGRNCKRRRSQTVQAGEGDDAVSTWPVTLLLTAKMWIFLPYVTCLYRCNSTAIKRITGKEPTAIRACFVWTGVIFCPWASGLILQQYGHLKLLSPEAQTADQKKQTLQTICQKIKSSA